MTGAEIVGELLRTAAPVVAMVPAERIKGGKLPDGVTLPALLVRTVSVVERIKLKTGGTVRVFDRVAVTVRAASYADQIAIIALVKQALRGRVGNLAGANRVSITTAGTGPDLTGPADSFEQAADFRVSFDATT